MDKPFRAVPFKSVGGGGTEVFLKGGGGGGEEGPNSELFHPIKLYMFSGRRGEGGVESLTLTSIPPPPYHTFKRNGPKQ